MNYAVYARKTDGSPAVRRRRRWKALARRQVGAAVPHSAPTSAAPTGAGDSGHWNVVNRAVRLSG